MATLDFTGLDLMFNARPGYANTVTLSQSGDTYTFTTDSADVITAITNAPKDYKYRVKGLGKTVVEITSVDASIASITFNLGDRDDAVRVNSARDGLVVLGGPGVDAARLSNRLNLAGSLNVHTETIHLENSGVSGASVTTTGAQSYLGDLWLEANVRLQSSGVVTLGGYVDGARSVSVTAGGMLVHGAVGDTVPLTSLSVSVGQALEIATSLETTGDILLSVHDAPSSGQDIVLQAGSSLSSSGGNIALLAGDNIDLRLGSSLSAAGQLTLSGDYGDADPGVGSIVGVSGVLIAGGAALTGGNDDDVFDIDDNAAAEGGSLAHLFAALAVTGGGGTDVLRLNDSGRTDPTHVTLTSTSIGAGPDDTWFAAGIPVTYTGIEDLQMATGAGADMVDVVSTHPGNTRIDTGPGADQLIIRSNSGVTSLSTGDGDDTTRVFVPADAASLLGGTLAISAGGSTNDVLLLDGSGFTTSVQIELSADQVTGLSAVPVAYQGVGQLQIRLGTGTDLTEIISTHAGHTTVDAGSGADRFYVRSTSGPTLILAGDDSDFVRVSSLDATLSGINGLLELRAGVDDNDILALDDSGSALGATVQLDSETITGLGSTAIVYRDVDYLQVSLGTGDDVVDVVSTHRGETLVDTGAGADEIAVTSTDGVTRLLSATGNDAIRIGSPDVGLAAMRGEIDVSAGNGSQDRLVLDDRSATVAASIVMSASAVLGAAPAPIHFDTTEALELYLGSGGDVVEIDSTHAGATLLDAGGGQDQVFVRATDGVSALHAGPEGATIYVGSPTADVADLRGLLQVDGASGGPTILIVDDSGNTAGRTVELTSNRLEGLSPAPIEYRAISDLLIQFGSGDDVVTVAGTHEGTTTLLMNAGNDVVIGRSTDGATSVDGGAGLQDLLQAGNEVADTVVLSAAALVLSAQGVELARLSYVDDTFERFDLTTDNGGDNTYSVTLGAEAGANGPGKFGFDPGLPGTGKTISLTDYSGFNVLSFADSRGGVRFDASLLDGTPQTVDAAGSRLQVAGNFQRFVGSAYDDELFAPTAELQIGTDPANPFNLAPILTGFGSDATRAQLGELLGSFGASMSPSELGSLLGAFGNALSAEQLGDLLGAFRRTVVAGAGDDLVGGGLFGTYDLGSGNNRFIQAETAPVADSLLRSFAGGAPLQTADLGAVLGGFRVEVTAGNGDDAVEAGILASLDLGGGSNQFVQSQSAGELIGLGQFLVQTTDSAATGQWGTLFNGLAGTTSSDVAATVLSAFAGAIGLTEVGTLLGGFGAGTTNLAQLGGLVGGFGNAADPTQLAALGQLLGGFGGSLTGPQLGSLLGGFGAAASPAALGPVLGGFGSAVTASQLGALVGGFGTSVTAEQLGRLLGGFGTGLSATQLGSLLGGFGGAVRSADLGAVLGGFGSVALHPDDLGSLLGAFSAVLGTPVPALEDVAQAFGSAQLTSTQLGSVLGSYQDALGTGALVVLSTLLSGFGTGSGNLAELGAVLGGFGNAVPAAAQPELGAVLAGFGGSLTASQLGTLLGGFGAASATDALGAVLGGFGGAVSASQLGTLLGSFGGAVAAQDLGRLLGGFGAGLTSAQLGTLIGGFGGAVTPPALGAVLGGFSAAALTTTDIDALLAAFRTATGTPLASLTEVAEAFGGAASNSVQLGSVLGGFGLGTGSALNTGTLVVLGTLLGGFGAGTTNLAQLGGLVGGFGNAADPTQLAALGQLLGGFGAAVGGAKVGDLLGGFAGTCNTDRLPAVVSAFVGSWDNVDLPQTLHGFADSLQLDDVGHLLGGFVAVQGRAELDAVLAASSADLSAEVFGTLSAVIRSYADGLINRAQLDVQLAELAAQFSPEELETVLDTLTGDLSPMQLGQALAGFATTLQPEKLGNLLAGFVDSDKAAGLAALLAALRATISTGPGDDVVSGVVLTTFRTHAGDDILFAGTTDASFLINALVDAGFSLPTAYASLAVSGAVLNGGAGDDTYYLIGELLGHLKLVEAAEVGTDTSRDTIDLSGFGGGAARVDLAQASEQTVHQGALWLTLSSGTGWEDVVGTRWADTIAGNDRDNQLFGSDPLESRAMLPPRRAVSTQYVYLDFDSETNSGEYLYSPSERETIRARLNEYYRGPDPAHPWFDFQFVLTPPASSTYVTVLFNRTPDNEAAGGLSEEIDFRNLNRDTRVYVDVNGLLGGPGQPAATGENFAALSITIAAHEVGHSAGARHFYASGPIGFGIHVPPGPDAYKPSYPGLVAALETTLHVMASPASVGSSLSQAVESLFFSERTAIVLAFAEQGVVVQEDAAATQSPGGQALGELPGLLVPNTIRRGLNAHRDLAVAAIDVVGSIDIDPATGKSESDWYSFAGRVGDVINIEMMSASQTRFAGNAIDAILRLYGADGTLIPSGAGTLAFNDDQFESSDAQIIDFVLPADGVYYVEVDTFHIRLPEFLGTAGGPGYLPPGFSVDGFVAENPDSEIVKDTDTGAYELFLFRFDAGNAMDGGDAIDGRSGNDVLAGFAGNDVLIGGAGSDKFLFDDRSLQDLDTVEGGTGRDRLDFSMRTAGINISLADTGSAQNLGGTQFLRLPHEDLEDIIGTLADDQLIGNSLDNFLVGDPGLDPLRGGNDKIVGASGDDVLIGHAGDDDITGSSGDDVLIGGYGVDRLAASAGADILFAGELQGTAEGDLRPANYNGADWDWWNNYELLRALSLWWSAGFDPDATTDDESLWGPDDAARDVLTGGTGPDWFVVGADDVITDLAGNGDRDRVTRL